MIFKKYKTFEKFVGNQWYNYELFLYIIRNCLYETIRNCLSKTINHKCRKNIVYQRAENKDITRKHFKRYRTPKKEVRLNLQFLEINVNEMNSSI